VSALSSPSSLASDLTPQVLREAPSSEAIAAAEARLLRQVAHWRTLLVTAAAQSQPALPPEDLDLTVQLTLLRLLFLRLCEERGLEPHGRLRTCGDGSAIYDCLQRLFRRASRRYACALFCFAETPGTAGYVPTSQADALTPRLKLADAPLREVLADLYAPPGLWDGGLLSPAILGQVYELFLETAPRAGAGAGARGPSEEQRSLKKASGIYYTPAALVDYVLAQSVGALLQEGTPSLLPLRTLDPCCGAGSFLTRLYRYLLDWYRAHYLAAGPQLFPRALRRDQHGAWHLTLAERARILLEHVYGVDIDRRAVEVTRLALFLMLLEDVEAWERADAPALLARLHTTIRCGDALAGEPGFDWRSAYPRPLSEGGFAAVIGNPPYLFGEQRNREARPHLEATFHLARSQYDACWLFIEQGLKLTRPGGRFAFVVPDALLARDEARRARTVLLQEGLTRVYHCGPVFRACVSAAVLVVARGARPAAIACDEILGSRAPLVQTHHLCNRERFLRDPRHRLLVHLSDEEAAILERVEAQGTPLGHLVHISRGEETGKRHVTESGPLPILAGDDLTRYHIAPATRFVQTLAKPASFYAAPKILVVKTGRRCVAALECNGLATMQSLYNLHLLTGDIAYEALLAVLNSRFVDCFLYKTFTAYKRLFPQLNQTTLATIPIPSRLAAQQGTLITAAREMIELQTRLATAASPEERQRLRQRSASLDEEINALVYWLYGLSAQETRTLERNV
jgi:hypothetical protein